MSSHQALGRVLVVDDDPAVTEMLSLVLGHYGFDVTCRATLADGRAAATDHAGPVLLDLALPDGPGLELLRELARRGQANSVTVISGTPSQDELRKAESLRPRKVLRKPFDVLSVIQDLRAACEAFMPRPAAQPAPAALRW
jgi:DNA-binding response OmpR family regulator